MISMRTACFYIFTLFVASKSAAVDAGCGQSFSGFVTNGKSVSFQLSDSHEQGISLIDTNNTFVPVVMVKDSEGRYIDNVLAADCTEKKCQGKIFTMKELPREAHILELIPDGNGGAFQVDVLCTDGLLTLNSKLKCHFFMSLCSLIFRGPCTKI